ncbi:polysaccharide deacetylase family protein [Paenibacillus senegalimassiliensis]|uniref:polysaccharide deacetylase family protein n=1 Tax=Paenibacillus senegalimassiliensis TaxID=1737426 RepID=UPI00073E7CFF|nr:polysaccharide deacetylase family protein [Paenibacillus senegalimassiliensis]
MPEMKGTLVISLDFELYWGLRDLYSMDEYQAKWLRERETIPHILDLFRQAGVHATWATVGLLFFEHHAELLAGLPALRPTYKDCRLSPYEDLDERFTGLGEQEAPHSYAPSLIKQICATPGQAVGSHTFSHYYCREPGQTKEQFYSDLQAAQQVAGQRGIALRSLVLPRNQWQSSYMDGLGELGFLSYRGNPDHPLYKQGYSTSDSPWRRVLRLADSYCNLTGHHTYDFETLDSTVPVNLPASFFFRTPPGLLRSLEPLRLRRIKQSMTHAARRGEVYHLWLHPYNAVGSGLKSLEALMVHYSRLSAKYGMTSLNMEELADLVLGEAESYQ